MKNREALIITLKELKEVLVDEMGNKICCCGEIITQGNRYSAHHIDPVRNNGKTVPPNIAPLCEITHPRFNFIEARSNRYAKVMNDGFLQLKMDKDREIVFQLHDYMQEKLEEFEYDAESRLYLRKQVNHHHKVKKRKRH